MGPFFEGEEDMEGIVGFNVRKSREEKRLCQGWRVPLSSKLPTLFV